MELPRSLKGVEVPFLSGDSINFALISLPPYISQAGVPSASPIAPNRPRDAASCFAFEDPPSYTFWRIHKSMPYALELVELHNFEEFQTVGLRIVFPDDLYPFCHICKNEPGDPSTSTRLLYTMTVRGIAYCINLKSIASYVGCSVFPTDDFYEVDVLSYLPHGEIYSAAATMGCVIVGRNDGSLGCFYLGIIDKNSPGFFIELRDDIGGISRFWGLMSRTKSAGSVQDLRITYLNGTKLAWALHSNGILNVWDLVRHTKLLSYTFDVTSHEETSFLRLWIGEADHELNVVSLAVLCRTGVEPSPEIVAVCRFGFDLGKKVSLFPEPPVKKIHFTGECVIDVIIVSKTLWILHDKELTLHNVFDEDYSTDYPQCFALHEEFISDHLFQSSKYSSDDLIWMIQSTYISQEATVSSFLSSLFLRRLLHPRIHQQHVIQKTFQDYNRQLIDSRSQSSTVDNLKHEILSLIEQTGLKESSTAIFYHWKNFCNRYFQNWCSKNLPYGLFLEPSSGAVGLIRGNSISVFRSLFNAEQLFYGCVVQFPCSFGKVLNFSDLETEILFDVFHCIGGIGNQLGSVGPSVFYESVFMLPNSSHEDVLTNMMKVLRIGYSSSLTTARMSDIGVDVGRVKNLLEHKNLRMFSVNMVQDLRHLHSKAVSWNVVLNVIKHLLELFVPGNNNLNSDIEAGFGTKMSILVEATSHFAEVVLETLLYLLLLLHYIAGCGDQIYLLSSDIVRIKSQMIPLVSEIITKWVIVYYLSTKCSESPIIDDFNFQLASLKIGGNVLKRSWKDNLGSYDFTLAYILILNCNGFASKETSLFSPLLGQDNLTDSVYSFVDWLFCGISENSTTFITHFTDVALIFFKNGQYDAVEFLLNTVGVYGCEDMELLGHVQDASERCASLHLLGCCFLAQAHKKSDGAIRDRKMKEAVCCFFRVSSGPVDPLVLQRLSSRAGPLSFVLPLGDSFCNWKLQYYQWAMQMFENYGFIKDAYQFALAALEQVDVSPCMNDSTEEGDVQDSTVRINGQLWSNVFKFTLDLDNINDAYCAIISNPDDESKSICLRRFVNVLYERGEMKMLCSGKLPFIGLMEQVERELELKASLSDVLSSPNMYKLLYSLEMHKHNWRKAAAYLYQYSTRLKSEASLNDCERRSLMLKERLNGLSASINALHLVHPSHAYVEHLSDVNIISCDTQRTKKSKNSSEQQFAGTEGAHRCKSYVGIEELEKEFLLTSAEHMLALESLKWTYTGIADVPFDLIELLVKISLYDMALTVIQKFCKGSIMNRELEKLFISMTSKRFTKSVDLSIVSLHPQYPFAMSAEENTVETCNCPFETTWDGICSDNMQWGILELYLEKYKKLHPTLPLVVAKTLLSHDPNIELPLWLVDMFKEFQKDNTWGMAGHESSPASLFRLYVNYSRYKEAAALLLNYIESFNTMRPEEIIHRKRPFSVWFPYAAIEQLFYLLEDGTSAAGHVSDVCKHLKAQLSRALLPYLNQVKVDSEDVLSAAGVASHE